MNSRVQRVKFSKRWTSIRWESQKAFNFRTFSFYCFFIFKITWNGTSFKELESFHAFDSRQIVINRNLNFFMWNGLWLVCLHAIYLLFTSFLSCHVFCSDSNVSVCICWTLQATFTDILKQLGMLQWIILFTKLQSYND